LDNKRYIWIDFAKAFAILGVILNHLVEAYGSNAWFTNPSAGWPSLMERLSMLIPAVQGFTLKLVYFAGWLGDFFLSVSYA